MYLSSTRRKTHTRDTRPIQSKLIVNKGINFPFSLKYLLWVWHPHVRNLLLHVKERKLFIIENNV